MPLLVNRPKSIEGTRYVLLWLRRCVSAKPAFCSGRSKVKRLCAILVQKTVLDSCPSNIGRLVLSRSLGMLYSKEQECCQGTLVAVLKSRSQDRTNVCTQSPEFIQFFRIHSHTALLSSSIINVPTGAQDYQIKPFTLLYRKSLLPMSSSLQEWSMHKEHTLCRDEEYMQKACNSISNTLDPFTLQKWFYVDKPLSVPPAKSA